MNKICTTISQSKRLMELGLSADTADCCWWYAENKQYPYIGTTTDPNAIPAWSLAALLELIPIVNENTYTMRGTLDGGAIISHEELTCVVSQEDNPLDAVFEMVCWLLENKKI